MIAGDAERRYTVAITPPYTTCAIRLMILSSQGLGAAAAFCPLGAHGLVGRVLAAALPVAALGWIPHGLAAGGVGFAAQGFTAAFAWAG